MHSTTGKIKGTFQSLECSLESWAYLLTFTIIPTIFTNQGGCGECTAHTGIKLSICTLKRHPYSRVQVGMNLISTVNANPQGSHMVLLHAEQGLPGNMHQLTFIGKPLHMLFKDSCTEIKSPTVELHPVISHIDLNTVDGNHQIPAVGKIKHTLVDACEPIGILSVDNRRYLVESINETSTVVCRFPFTGKPTVADISVSN